MFVIADNDIASAIKSFEHAGFKCATWSYGSAVDPITLPNDPLIRQIHERKAASWASLDRNSVRFNFPSTSSLGESYVILLRTSYVGITLPTSDQDPNFQIEAGLYYPKASILLESIVKLRVKGDTGGQWMSLLEVWAIKYLYGYLHLPDNVLDDCGDEDVVRWWNQKIRRFEGGLQR